METLFAAARPHVTAVMAGQNRNSAVGEDYERLNRTGEGGFKAQGSGNREGEHARWRPV